MALPTLFSEEKKMVHHLLSNFAVRSYSNVREAPKSDEKYGGNKGKRDLMASGRQSLAQTDVPSTSHVVNSVRPDPVRSSAPPEKPTTASNVQPIAVINPKLVNASLKVITIATPSGPKSIFVQGFCPNPFHMAANVAPSSMKLLQFYMKSKSILHIRWSLADTRVPISEYWIFVQLPGRPGAASGTWNFMQTVPAVSNQFSMSANVDLSSHIHDFKSVKDLKIIVAGSPSTTLRENSQL